jgi:methylmalonyl-CoA mutase
VELDKELNLREEFPPPSYEEWRKTVEASLKGADFDKVMYTRTYEGITLKPIYREEDVKDLPFMDSLPGEAPYARGADPQKFAAEGWQIAQSHGGKDRKALNAQILKELQLGLNSVNIRLRHDADLNGVAIASIEDLHELLDGIDPIAAPLYMQLDATDSGIFPLLGEYLKGRNIDPAQVKAGIGFDPTSELARKGYLSLSLEETWERVGTSVQWVLDNAPGIRCLSIDGGVYAGAGASSLQELGFALSTAIGYIDGLMKSGWEIDRIAPLFQVKLTLGSNFFMEIAKVRAFRLIWAEMVKAYGGNAESQKVWIHGRTGSFNKSSYDIYVNLLRTATESFSGVIGGVDSLEVDTFNKLASREDEFVRRLARNQQIILKEEAHFGKVMDPAGGCYYIESLTSELASGAWKLMQDLEIEGGMIRSLIAGKVHAMIEPVAKARIEAVNKRKDVFVGVNMYADPAEPAPQTVNAEKAQDPVRAVELQAGPLPKLRAVEAIELLRSRIVNSKSYKKIFLLNMGSLAEYKARADFASGFFQVGGFEVESPSGFTNVAEAAEAAKASGAAAFCVCSTDDNYRHLAGELCQALPGKVMILAGYPADMVETYKQQGINIFIHIRADVRATLDELAVLAEVVK